MVVEVLESECASNSGCSEESPVCFICDNLLTSQVCCGSLFLGGSHCGLAPAVVERGVLLSAARPICLWPYPF